MAEKWRFNPTLPHSTVLAVCFTRLVVVAKTTGTHSMELGRGSTVCVGGNLASIRVWLNQSQSIIGNKYLDMAIQDSALCCAIILLIFNST